MKAGDTKHWVLATGTINFPRFANQTYFALVKNSMKRTEKLKSASNPLYFSNRKTKALEEALRVLLDAYEEYATQNSLTDEQASSAKQLIIDSYLERRAAYFVEHKLSSSPY
jgi:hypothetical protein